MFFLKKIIVKRILKKNAKEIQNVVKKTYRSVSKDLSKKVGGLKVPVKVTLTR